MGKPENPLILSIDDDQDTLKLIEKYVSKSEFNIVTFDRVAKARTFLEEVKPDLILVDIQMPETNGYEFSLSLQNNDKFSSIPVVFLSVLRREQDKAQAFASGAVDYLIKPINKEKLIKTIKTNLRKSKEWDLLHRKTKFSEIRKFNPDFKKFRGFLSVKLNPSSDIKKKSTMSGFFNFTQLPLNWESPASILQSSFPKTLVYPMFHLSIRRIFN